jgi:hypothetical protein
MPACDSEEPEPDSAKRFDQNATAIRTKELAEHVEWIVETATTLTALLMLLEAVLR